MSDDITEHHDKSGETFSDINHQGRLAIIRIIVSSGSSTIAGLMVSASSEPRMIWMMRC